MTRLIALRYVGKKPTAYDNIARSGKSWAGFGDVQEVTDAQAKLLLKYPDQWELVHERDRKAVEAPTSIQVQDEDGQGVSIDPDTLKKPLEHMSKTELKAYAFNLWGQELDARKSTKAMIDQIEEWANELEPKVGL